MKTRAINSIFLNPEKLIDDDLELVLVKKIPADKGKGYFPMYEFDMKNTVTHEKMWEINLRIGYNENIHYGGHIWYGVDEKFRGHHYAARSVKLLFPLAKKHGLNPILITCNPENMASRKACEYAGGKLVEILNLPEDNDQYQKGERQKCIYTFDL